MKYLFSICLSFLFVGIALAQDDVKVVLRTETRDYLEINNNELASVVGMLDKNLTGKKEMKTATQNKARLIRLLSSSSNSVRNINEILLTHLDIKKNPEQFKDDAIADALDAPCDGYFELALNEQDCMDFKTNSERVTNIYYKVQNTKYAVHPLSEDADINMEMLKEYVELVSNNLAILTSHKVR